ncbi:MAG TPA: protein TolQ, partial [Marinobacter adhaerens]|nr:protein TolQ [Marinobacter adhaerens]
MDSELSVWYLIANAGVLVQLVMLLLALASIMSWALIFQRLQVFRKAKRAQLAFEERFWSGMDLGQLYREVNADPTPFSGMESLFRAGFKEFSRLRQQSR